MAFFSRILLPLALEGEVDTTVEYGAEIARRFGAEVVVLHLTETQRLGEAHRVEAATGQLADVVAYLERCEVPARSLARVLELPIQSAADAILDVADQERIDLIVMRTHGRRGVTRILLGSVTEEVLRRARCPVLAVHAEEL